MITINDPGPAAKKIEQFLQALRASSGLEFEFRIACKGRVQPEAQTPTQAPPQPSPEISVEFTGPDTPLLTARNAELLHAIEHLAAKVIRLEPDQHDRILFDAEDFKALRNRELEQIASAGAETVRATGRSFAFPPMNSRERRLLHLALAGMGLPTASSSDGPRRFVVAYPVGHQPAVQAAESRRAASIPGTHTGTTNTTDRTNTNDRTSAIRNSFRRR